MSDIAPRIVVIEDEAQIRRFVRSALEDEGCQVYEAATAAQLTALWLWFSPAAPRFLTHPIQFFQGSGEAPARAAWLATLKLYATSRNIDPYDPL